MSFSSKTYLAEWNYRKYWYYSHFRPFVPLILCNEWEYDSGSVGICKPVSTGMYQPGNSRTNKILYLCTNGAIYIKSKRCWLYQMPPNITEKCLLFWCFYSVILCHLHFKFWFFDYFFRKICVVSLQTNINHSVRNKADVPAYTAWCLCMRSNQWRIIVNL